jgi:hypothetical protein
MIRNSHVRLWAVVAFVLGMSTMNALYGQIPLPTPPDGDGNIVSQIPLPTPPDGDGNFAPQIPLPTPPDGDGNLV